MIDFALVPQWSIEADRKWIQIKTMD